MNGTPNVKVAKSARAALLPTGRWIGCSEYKQSKAYLEKVAPRFRPDYERTILLITARIGVLDHGDCGDGITRANFQHHPNIGWACASDVAIVPTKQKGSSRAL
jgi:hypothetical protein